MLKNIAIAVLLVFFASCSSSRKPAAVPDSSKSTANLDSKSPAMLDENSFKLTAVSDDISYGYTEKNPIKVGGVKNSSGPLNERRFLNALLGPAGEKITYERRGSCCPFDSPNGFMGGGMLDRYEVNYKGLEKPVILYINMYDPGELKAPKGFTFRQ